VLSRLASLVQQTEREMAAYRLYNVVPRLLSFIEELTNTYIRFNRPHFWQDGMPEDKRLAFETLYEVLHTQSRIMAPFAPFLAEAVYQNLADAHPKGRKESVHLETFPETVASHIRTDLEEAVAVMEVLVMLGRNYRENIGVKAKIPLKSMKVYQRDAKVLATLKKFETYFASELNIEKVEYLTSEDDVVQVTAKANFQVLGKKLGAKMKPVAAKVQSLPLTEILKLEKGATLKIEGEDITFEDVEIRRAPKAGHDNVSVHQLVSLEIDPSVSPAQIKEGLAREVIRKIQQARKNARFNLDDRIRLELACSADLKDAVEAHKAMIQEATLSKEFALCEKPAGKHTETVEIDEGVSLAIGITQLGK
jgi:isoleucyl-tRNA synthetase